MTQFLCTALELMILLPGMLVAYLPMRDCLRIPPAKLAAVTVPLVLFLCAACGAVSCLFHVGTVWLFFPATAIMGFFYVHTLSITRWKSISVFLAICGVFSCLGSTAIAVNGILSPGDFAPPLSLRGALFWLVLCCVSVLAVWHPTTHASKKLLEEDFNFYSKKRTGDLMSRQTGDMDAIRHFVASIIYSVYQNVLLFAFALVMIFTVSPKLALCMLVVLPFTAISTFKQSKEVKPAFQRNRNCFSSLNAFVQENISGNRVVKAFAKEEFEKGKFQVENDRFRDAQIKGSRVWMKYVPVFEILAYALSRCADALRRIHGHPGGRSPWAIWSRSTGICGC